MVICYWTIALVNLFSMRHIYRSQKPLEKIRIYPKKCIFRAYIVLWIGLCIFFTSLTVIDTIAVYNFELLESAFYVEFYLVIGIIFNIFFIMIDCLILYTILLLSNKIEEDKLALITESLK